MRNLGVSRNFEFVEEAIGCELAESPLDLKQLSQQTSNDGDLQQEILRLFARQMIIAFDRLIVCSRLEDWLEITSCIQDGANSVGAVSLAQVARNAALSENGPHGSARETCIAQIEAEMHVLKKFIAEFLDQNS